MIFPNHPSHRSSLVKRKCCPFQGIMMLISRACVTKPVMNSFTYMRSEGDCVLQIPYEQATVRHIHVIDSEVVHRVMLIFQDLETSTQSARIRTDVNKMMTRFVVLYGAPFGVSPSLARGDTND